MDELRVLVIDDNREFRERITKYVLEPNGFKVETAADGADGLFKALTNTPDLILMDFEMPNLTGIEVLRQLRERNNNVPVILMTGHGSEATAIDVFRLDAQDYLVKPFTSQQLLEAIEGALSAISFQRDQEQLTLRTMQANQEFEQHIHELNILYQVSKSITALREPDKMLNRIVDAVLFITRSEACILVLLNPKTGQPELELKKERSDPEQQASPNGEHRLAPIPVQANAGDSLEDAVTKTVLTLPLQVGKKVVGILSIRKHIQGGMFTLHDDQMLRMLTDYAAIAIHNLQLMHDLRATKEREKDQIRRLFERYVAPTVVEQMLAQPEKIKLGGLRQTVTVLFADVRGFSTFSTGMKPELLVQILNYYMRIAADAVLAEEGTLDKFMGDAVMAFFNAPVLQQDHPLRAIRAARALCRWVKQLHAHLPREYRLHFGVGVGVGEAVVGNIGTSQIMNFTVIGDSVNKVKRLQENAQGGQILIDERTYDLVQDQVEVRYVGNLLLKGQDHPEPVYEVLSITDASYEEISYDLPPIEIEIRSDSPDAITTDGQNDRQLTSSLIDVEDKIEIAHPLIEGSWLHPASDSTQALDRYLGSVEWKARQKCRRRFGQFRGRRWG